MLRQQQAAASKSFASSSAFAPEPPTHHSAPRSTPILAFNSDSDSDEADEALFAVRKDDLTDYSLGGGAPSEAATPHLEAFPSQLSPRRTQSHSVDTGKSWAFDVNDLAPPPTPSSPFGVVGARDAAAASAYAYERRSDSWSGQRGHRIHQHSYSLTLSDRIANFFGFGPSAQHSPNPYSHSHSIHKPHSGRRAFTSPRTLVLITLAALVLAFMSVLSSSEIRWNDLKDLHVDESLLGHDGIDYVQLIESLKKSGRTPTRQEQELLYLDQQAKDAARWSARIAGVVGKFVGGRAKSSPVVEKKQQKGSKVKGKKTITVTAAPGANKKPTGRDNILGLDQVPRRYRYGANFQPPAQTSTKDSNSQDTSDEEVSSSAARRPERLTLISLQERQRKGHNHPDRGAAPSNLCLREGSVRGGRAALALVCLEGASGPWNARGVCGKARRGE